MVTPPPPRPSPPSNNRLKRAFRRQVNGHVFLFPMTLLVLFLLTVIALLVSFFAIGNGPNVTENGYGLVEMLMAAKVNTDVNVTAENLNGMEETMVTTLDSSSSSSTSTSSSSSSSSSTSTSTSTVAFISLRATAQLFVAVAAGVLLARNGGLLNAETVKGLSKLTYCMFQPALIFCSVSRTLQSESGGAAAAAADGGGDQGPGLSSLAILVLPVASLLQIACGYSTGRMLTRLFSMPCHQANTKDVWMCTTFANSAPLPLVFADSLFANNLAMKADVTACISFYLLVWSPIFWTVGPRMLEAQSAAPDSHHSRERSLTDVEYEYELDGSKNKGDSANNSTNIVSTPESPSRPYCSASSIEQMVRKILLTPPVVGSIMGVVVGTSPILQALFLDTDGLAAPFYGAAQTFASAYLPATILVLAGSMVASTAEKDIDDNDGNELERPADRLDHAGKRKPPMPQLSPPGGTSTSRQLSWRAISCITVARFVINPILTSTILNVVSTRTNLLGLPNSRTTAVLQFVILMQGCMPPAQNSVVMLQMEHQTGRATRMTTLLTVMYCLAIVPVTFHMSRGLAATSVTTF